MKGGPLLIAVGVEDEESGNKVGRLELLGLGLRALKRALPGVGEHLMRVVPIVSLSSR